MGYWNPVSYWQCIKTPQIITLVLLLFLSKSAWIQQAEYSHHCGLWTLLLVVNNSKANNTSTTANYSCKKKLWWNTTWAGHDCNTVLPQPSWLQSQEMDFVTSWLKWLFLFNSSLLCPFITVIFIFYCHINYQVTWHETHLSSISVPLLSLKHFPRNPERSRLRPT